MLQLTSRLGSKRIGQPSPDRECRRYRAGAACALVVLCTALAGCEPTRSFERTADGSTIYMDDLSDAAKAEARQKIAETLTRGIGVYALGVGDEIEAFFHIKRRPTPREYVITAADKLRVEFLGDKDNSQTVQVRPDGRISLPLIGPVMAAGQTAVGLARQLEQRYSNILSKPEVTINVTESHTRLDDFLSVLSSSTKSRSITDNVLPDGTIAMPLLPPLRARGRTLDELTNDIDRAYAAKGLDVYVSLVPRNLKSNASLVIGEVTKPGRYELDRPVTVSMAVAQAGGILTTGSRSSVRLFYIGPDGAPRVRGINLDEVVNDFRLDEDMIVPRNSVIYVPPSDLAKTGRLVDAIARQILRFQGYSIGGGYNIE